MAWRLAATLNQYSLALAATAALFTATGCSRQTGIQASGSNTAPSTQPLAKGTDASGLTPTGSLAPDIIPAGTPITIRLQAVISSDASHSGDSFAAVLDEPIMVHDQIIAASGVPIIGKVLAAKPSDRVHDPGYLRLTLAAISIHGKLLPLQASSIFAKGRSGGARPSATRTDDVGFAPDRRLTFRLTQSLSVGN